MSGCCREELRPDDRTWVNEAIRKVEADSNRSADTHLHVFPLPADWGIDLICVRGANRFQRVVRGRTFVAQKRRYRKLKRALAQRLR